MESLTKKFKVLIVDDVNTIRASLVNHLTRVHHKMYPNYVIETDTARDGLEALEKAETNHYDLVISDIIMPNMNGFELISSLSRRFPKLCTVLITSNDVEDYMKMAMVYNVTNIITKTNPFNYEEFSKVVHTLLTKEHIFGLEYYLKDNTPISTMEIDNKDLIRCAIDRILDIAMQTSLDKSTVKKFVLSTEEALLNACVYTSMDNVNRERPDLSAFLEMKSFSPVKVSFGTDNEKIGISITDGGGKLSKEDILYWISRNIAGEGLLDNHGRGLFLMRVNTDRMIINVDPGRKTEVVLIKYLSDKYEGHKPLYINQI